MRVSLSQFKGGPDKADNLRRMLPVVEAAARAEADLVVFPECAMAALPPDRGLAPLAEPLDGPFVSALADAARRHRLAVVAGVWETVADDARVHNTVVALGPDGDLLGAYRKVHLYDSFGYRESDRVRPGPGDTLVLSLGGTMLGVQTCYDVRFPELSRHLVARGAEVLLLPAAWVAGPLKEAHWDVLVRARAIENTVYVAAAGLVGAGYTGGTVLVDPMGVTVSAAGEAETLLHGAVDPERLRAVRDRNPSLANARPDVYARWLPVPAG